MKARTVQVWLLCGARLFCQASRLSLGGLMPLVAADAGFSTAQKGSLLSAFPLGYLMTQVLGGAASDRWGGKPVMAVALFSTGVGTVISSSLQSFWAMWLVMLVVGALQGPSFPTNGVLLSRWIPRSERAGATAICDSGGPAGALVALFGTPTLATQFGWRATFALSGCCTLGFTLLWQLLAANDPLSCSYCTESEISELRAMGVVDTKKAEANGHPPRSASKCFWGILKIPAVWSVLFAHSFFNYSRYLMYNWVVTFYTDALSVPVEQAAFWMLWPTLADACTSLVVGSIADRIVNSGRLTMLATRRLFSSLGFCGTGLGALLVSRCTSPGVATIFVTIAAASEACHNAGFKSSYGDLSRQHAGLLTGLGNSFASASSFIVPLIAASLLDAYGGSSKLVAWQAVFGSVFLCDAVGALIYSCLVSCDSIDSRYADTPDKKKS